MNSQRNRNIHLTFIRRMNCAGFFYRSIVAIIFKVPDRHLIMPVLFRILYCCGLRLGEVLRLKVSDVDLTSGVLLIRDSKNGNDRYVPMSQELTASAAIMRQKCMANSLDINISFPRRMRHDTRNQYLTNFRRFLRKAGISHGGKGKGPRIYDFRHLCGYSLKQMVLANKDLAVYHQVLKTYMGHSFFKYTAYYLRLTKDMFPDIRQKIESHYESFITGPGGDYRD